MFSSSSFPWFPLFFGLVAVLILGVFVFVLVRGLSQWNRNNHSPRLAVQAVVTAKRTHMSSRSTAEPHIHHSTSTFYYATFQVESGDRIELAVSGYDYGQLCEGDRGRLTFQGTRYLGFERDR